MSGSGHGQRQDDEVKDQVVVGEPVLKGQESPHLNHTAKNQEQGKARRDEHEQSAAQTVDHSSRQLTYMGKPEEGERSHFLSTEQQVQRPRREVVRHGRDPIVERQEAYLDEKPGRHQETPQREVAQYKSP